MIPVTVTTPYGTATENVKIKVSAQPTVKEVKEITPKKSGFSTLNATTTSLGWNLKTSVTSLEWRLSCTPRGGTWSVIGKNFAVECLQSYSIQPKANPFPVADSFAYFKQVLYANTITASQLGNYMYLSTAISSVTEDEDSSTATIRVLKTASDSFSGASRNSGMPLGYYEPTICYTFAGNVVTYKLKAPWFISVNPLSTMAGKRLISQSNIGTSHTKLPMVVNGSNSSQKFKNNTQIYIRFGPVAFDAPSITNEIRAKSMNVFNGNAWVGL